MGDLCSFYAVLLRIRQNYSVKSQAKQQTNIKFVLSKWNYPKNGTLEIFYTFADGY